MPSGYSWRDGGLARGRREAEDSSRRKPFSDARSLGRTQPCRHLPHSPESCSSDSPAAIPGARGQPRASVQSQRVDELAARALVGPRADVAPGPSAFERQPVRRGWAGASPAAARAPPACRTRRRGPRRRRGRPGPWRRSGRGPAWAARGCRRTATTACVVRSQPPLGHEEALPSVVAADLRRREARPPTSFMSADAGIITRAMATCGGKPDARSRRRCRPTRGAASETRSGAGLAGTSRAACLRRRCSSTPWSLIVACALNAVKPAGSAMRTSSGCQAVRPRL